MKKVVFFSLLTRRYCSQIRDHKTKERVALGLFDVSERQRDGRTKKVGEGGELNKMYRRWKIFFLEDRINQRTNPHR